MGKPQYPNLGLNRKCLFEDFPYFVFSAYHPVQQIFLCNLMRNKIYTTVELNDFTKVVYTNLLYLWFYFADQNDEA